MLTDKQIRNYFEQGYLLVENVITDAQLKTLQNITYDFIEASKMSPRAMTSMILMWGTRPKIRN